MKLLDRIKKLLANKYNMKALDKVKTIIRWQATKNMAASTMKIDQSAFVKDFVIEKRLINCNTNFILIKARLAIKISNLKDYNKTHLQEY